MTDLTSVAREAAEREAERHWPVGREYSTAQTSAVFSVKELDTYCASALVRGFTECASRIPSEREIAKVMALTDDYDGCFERIEAWEAATQQERDCGKVEEPLSSDQEDCEFWLRRARAVISLIGEKISG